MDDFQQLLLETFAEEARETVQALEKALLELEQAGDDDARVEPFAVLARRAHNLKGAAGAAGVTTVQSLAHALEDALLGLRDLGGAPAPEVFDVLYVAVDTIRELSESGGAPATALEEQLDQLTELQRGAAASTAAASPEAPGDAAAVPAEDAQALAGIDAGDLGAPPELTSTMSSPSLQPALAPTLPSGSMTNALEDQARGPDELPMAAPPPRSVAHAPTAPAVQAPADETAAPAPTAPSAPSAPAAAETKPAPREPRRKAPARSTPGGGGGGSDDDTTRGPDAPRRTVRIAVDKLDALMNQIGEIITVRKKSQARLADVAELADSVTTTVQEFQSLQKLIDRFLRRSGALTEHGESFNPVAQGLDGFAEHLAELETSFIDFHRQALHEATTESLLTERLPEDIKRLRMRPFGTLEDFMRRAARDAARHSGKEVDLELVGMDAEADQVVLDVMRDPMMHLLRNCVDHGVERPAERLAAGKDPTGTVFVRVEARGATLYIRVGDDGAGIDTHEMRRRVRDRNLVPAAQLDGMSEQEVIDLIFLPGFSTASNVGVISGRGIGMDVVREVVQRHHGSVSVRTRPGEGTTFELTMPLTFATVQGIIVRVLGHDFAMPMYALDRLIRLSRKDITYIEGTPTVAIEEQPISIVPMSEILEVPPDFSRTQETPEWEEDAYTEAMLYGAVVRSGDKRIAFLVDDFVGESEMVVKDIPAALGRIRNVSGATITWSGEVMVILNPADLIASALRKAAGGIEKEWTTDRLLSRRVLVCDDSVTTRTLEKNILAAAGYDVVTATNGLEALKIAEEQSFQLIVLDVDMPEMTGFELASRLRMTPAYRDVPIILVTSRDTEEDKRRGLAAGADAYITKQSFTQRTFLETVRRFLA